MTAPKQVWQLLLKPNGFVATMTTEDRVKEGRLVFDTFEEAMEAVNEHHYETAGETR